MGEGSPDHGRLSESEGAHPQKSLPDSYPQQFCLLFGHLVNSHLWGFRRSFILPSPGRVFRAGADLFLELGFTTDILNSVCRVMGFRDRSHHRSPIGLIMGHSKLQKP